GGRLLRRTPGGHLEQPIAQSSDRARWLHHRHAARTDPPPLDGPVEADRAGRLPSPPAQVRRDPADLAAIAAEDIPPPLVGGGEGGGVWARSARKNHGACRRLLHKCDATLPTSQQ